MLPTASAPRTRNQLSYSLFVGDDVRLLRRPPAAFKQKCPTYFTRLELSLTQSDRESAGIKAPELWAL